MTESNGTAGDTSASGPRRRLGVRVLLLLVLWTLPALLLSGQISFMGGMEGRPVSFWHLLGWQILVWYIWAAATPLIVWLARAVPVARPRLARGIVVHLGAFVLTMLLSAAYATVITRWIAPAPLSEYSAVDMFVFFFLLQRVHISVFTYGGILGVTYALDYSRKYRERELQTSELQAQLAQAQLQALKMQLHPHFLFNTLNAISMLVRKGANDEAVRMLVGLSDLLRVALENIGTQEVSLKQELEFLERYLELQQIRFQDRLSVRMTIEPETLDARVPNMILQPLVENAIRHGIAPRSSAGLVQISARREENRLHVEVRDNGPGLSSDNGPDREGVGLTNTRKRLRGLYGDEHRFELTNGKGTGAVAVLEIPFRHAGT